MGCWHEDTSQKSLKIPGIEVFDFNSQVYCVTKKYIYEEAFISCNRADVKYTTNQEIYGFNLRYSTNLYLSMANLTAFRKGAIFLV
jgi:hypothetical protein